MSSRKVGLTKTNSGLVKLALLVAVLGSALQPSPAFAHAANDFYAHWYQQSDRNVTWKFKANVPNTAVRDRIIDAPKAWNQTNGDMVFDKQVADVANVNWGDCPAPGNSVVFWTHIDGPVGDYLADSHWCDYVDTNYIKTFQIRFDDEEAWYLGTSTPPPSDKYDLQAAATHEFGHATGFGFGPNIP
jgi:Matrixin